MRPSVFSSCDSSLSVQKETDIAVLAEEKEGIDKLLKDKGDEPPVRGRVDYLSVIPRGFGERK
jgi:hypothetical protein